MKSECAKCGSAMQPGQDWCLQCGTGVPGGLGSGWRTLAAILVATVLLVVGASVAAYAALNESKPKPATLALAKAPVSSPPAATPTPGTTVPGATPVPGTPTTIKGAPPKIGSSTPTPSSGGPDEEANNALFPPETKTSAKAGEKSSGGATTAPAGESGKSGAEGGSEAGSEGGSEAKGGSSGGEGPSPLLLDTDAASVYNPYAYPATLFGDPSLAIDGEAKTAWTAQVQPADAPLMAEGMLLDLRSPQKLGSALVKTSTVASTVEIYGSNAKTPPSSISDPQWTRLVGLKVLKKKSTKLKLKTAGKGYRYVLLWLAKAPPSSTAAAPGVVSIDEFELFPPA